MVKRVIDIVVSLTLLIMLVPVILLVALFIRLLLGAPVFYSQSRPGLKSISFRLYKFRSMTEQRDEKGEILPDAQRLTKFGRFLRASSLDELPTLWNVLRGDMSLVGPRPLLVEYLPLYSEEQSRRHDVKPGVTGWAQVNGRNALSWSDKFKLDVWYVDNQSLWLDLRIVAMTLKSVLLREGISHPGEVTMKKFSGNN